LALEREAPRSAVIRPAGHAWFNTLEGTDPTPIVAMLRAARVARRRKPRGRRPLSFKHERTRRPFTPSPPGGSLASFAAIHSWGRSGNTGTRKKVFKRLMSPTVGAREA
jgi:hypothetical protein